MVERRSSFSYEELLACGRGEMFGPGGEGHMRMNIGAPREYVEQGLRQLADAVRRQFPRS